ncbi:RNA-binding S4 domain-containing protein [Sphingomonas sp. MMS24-J13]|uniref:RNA-binding S4 domain-containing protein n=1 Tax=Sphingomonas sp. MMS24-J13 TaxID=3238686 RepID=UPI00384FC392
MRIDKFLCFVRLVKTRGLAQQLIEQGHLRVDGKPTTRASAEVKVGTVLTFPLNDHVRVLRVEALPERRGPAPEARACYTDLSAPTG